MLKNIKFSLNDYIKVKLNDKGKQILLSKFKNLKFYKEYEVLNMYKFNNYFITIQMFEFIQLFGNELSESNQYHSFDLDSLELIVNLDINSRIIESNNFR